MSRIALYRKYRPAKFSDVRGQKQVTDILLASLKNNTTSHAYLFSGPRGTGKTSIARIFARELGCEQEDLYEIDGASNRGIDEIRALKENVGTLPFKSAVKVYVIDEVHMLTKDAFNALLKTLEEPPEYVVFMLATTELHKVPDTIVSRCQSFIFKRAGEKVLKTLVSDIAKAEKISLDDEAAALIAFLGEGSFRDTIGALDQVSVLSGKGKITRDAVAEITGSPSKELLHNFIESILEGSLDRALGEVRSASQKNMNMKVYARLILKHMRYAMLLSLAHDMKDSVCDEVGADECEYLEKLGAHQNADIIPRAIKELIVAYGDIGYAYIPELPLELALVNIIGGKQES
jgi:DNA polymerase III subunit gamma/tau